MTAAISASKRTITLGEKSYQMSPLSYKEIGEFEEWMRSAYMEQQSKLCEHVPASMQSEFFVRAGATAGLLAMAVDKEANPDIFKVADSIIRSLPGSTRLMWLSIRRNHPDVELDEIGEYLSDPSVLGSLLATFNEMNTEPDAQTSGKAKKKVYKKRKTKR